MNLFTDGWPNRNISYPRSKVKKLILLAPNPALICEDVRTRYLYLLYNYSNTSLRKHNFCHGPRARAQPAEPGSLKVVY